MSSGQQTARSTDSRSGAWRPELIDLSRPLTAETPQRLLGDLSSHHKGFGIEYVSDWSNSNGTNCLFSVPDHLGTHMDAPIHAVDGGGDLSTVDIRRLVGEAVCLDLFRGDVDYGYTAADFATAEPAIEAGDIVLIYSGWQDVEPDARIRQTYLTPEGAEWLVERGVHAVGCEPAGIEHVPDGLFVHEWYDKNTPHLPSWPAHQILLKAEIYIIEGLVNLDQIRGQRVRFAALPLNVPGLSGCPIRAVAWTEA